jgi:hypothetical protein
VTRVKIHPSIKAIKELAFQKRRQFLIVILNDGLEEIGDYAFYTCKLLQSIGAIGIRQLKAIT